MKKTDLAYMAGIFDGEGCIFISKENSKQIKAPLYVLNARIGMANPYIPKLFHFVFGGYFYEFEPKRSPRQKNWVWIVKSKKAKEFLVIIKSYLRLKQNEAELAIQFQSAKKVGALKGQWGAQARSKESLAVEEAQRILLHSLKVKSKE